MSVLTIKSAKLGRIVRVCDSREEAREVWREFPEDRAGIYLTSEVQAMRGVEPEALKAIQTVKDVFLGAQVERVETIMNGGER